MLNVTHLQQQVHLQWWITDNPGAFLNCSCCIRMRTINCRCGQILVGVAQNAQDEIQNELEGYSSALC